MLRSVRRLAGVAALAVVLVIPATAQASHSWGGYHWARTSNPFTVKLGDNVTGAWDGYLMTTSSDWSQSTVLDTTIVAGGSPRPKQCRPTTGRVEVCNATYGNNGWLGVAGISITGGTHITQAYVKLNDTYFNTAQYNTPAWRNLVMCQEVGHTFGLDHQDETFGNANLGTCMDYTNNPSSNQHPNQHDYDQLVEIYAHLDSSSTVQAALPSGSAAAAASASAFGRLVASSQGGKVQTFVRDLGNGRLEVTHVIWA